MINYDNIQPCDIVLTSSPKLIACGIRIEEAGIQNTFNLKIANHVGIIIPIGGPGVKMFAIAEMLADGLKINSLSDYTKGGWFDDRIVDIKTFTPFQDPVTRTLIVDQVLSWWQQGKGYDYEGVLKYVLPFLKDKDGKFYCSEMVEHLALTIAKTDLLENRRTKNDNVTPYDIQKSKLLFSTGWNKLNK